MLGPSCGAWGFTPNPPCSMTPNLSSSQKYIQLYSALTRSASFTEHLGEREKLVNIVIYSIPSEKKISFWVISFPLSPSQQPSCCLSAYLTTTVISIHSQSHSVPSHVPGSVNSKVSSRTAGNFNYK